MGFERIPGTDAFYGLISYDADGHEEMEDAGLMSGRVIQRALQEDVTDVFFFCHGWKGDQQSARDQYERWVGAFVASADYAAAPLHLSGFKPLYVGLHWPSLPFGDEDVRPGAFAAAGATGIDALLEKWIRRLGSREAIQEPLTTILNEARRNASPELLPGNVVAAYRALNDALELGSDDVAGAPDADRDEFDPQEAYEAGQDEGSSFGGGGINMGGILGPLQQLSYWRMKQRARRIGEGGMHQFLNNLQSATSQKKTRIHLMGHSFGTIVVSCMLGGPKAKAVLPRPVESLVLVQGAVSLWCYAPSIPFRVWLKDAGPGYFHRILEAGRVIGPIVTTRSKYDYAVGRLYPWASRLDLTAAPSFAGGLPKYGGIGVFGIQGVSDGLKHEMTMLPRDGEYSFEPGRVYNLDAQDYILKIESALSGAHSDIAGPEVAHAIWSAAFAVQKRARA